MRTRNIFLLVVVLLISLPFMLNVRGRLFSDISESNVFYDYIRSASEIGYMSGFSDGSFRDSDFVTRGQISKVLVSGLDIEMKPEYITLEFPDVGEDNVFRNYIKTLVAHAIVSGYPDDTYRTEKSVTRGEASKFIYNAIKSKCKDFEDPTFLNYIFEDVTVVSPFKPYIEKLGRLKLKNGNTILKGYSDGTFREEVYLTRGELSKIAYNARVFSKECLGEEAASTPDITTVSTTASTTTPVDTQAPTETVSPSESSTPIPTPMPTQPLPDGVNSCDGYLDKAYNECPINILSCGVLANYLPCSSNSGYCGVTSANPCAACQISVDIIGWHEGHCPG